LFFQDILLQRIIIVSLTQIWPIIYTSILAFKVIKRAKNYLTYTLSSIFIINSIIYILPIFSILFINTPFAYAFYIIPFFLFILIQGFIVIFSWLLTKLGERFPKKTFLVLILVYSLLSSYVFLFGIIFQGIRYDSTTGWIPVFSWDFAIISWLFSTIIFIIPAIILTFKIVKIYAGTTMIKRTRQFLIGFYLEFAFIYYLVLYNTWIENELFRIFNPIISLPLSIFSAYFLYIGFGKELT
jgi:hypothetical protein